MADDAPEPEEVDAPKRGNGLLLVIMLVNTLALIGGGVYFALFHQPASAEAPQAKPEPAPHEVGPMVELEAIVANLAEDTASRFVKLKMHLEVEDPEDQPIVEAAIVPIRNAVLLHLSSLTVDQTVGADNKEQIRKALQEKINETLGAPKVRRIFFTEFVVQ